MKKLLVAVAAVTAFVGAALPYFTLTYLEPQSNDTISVAGKFMGRAGCFARRER